MKIIIPERPKLRFLLSTFTWWWNIHSTERERNTCFVRSQYQFLTLSTFRVIMIRVSFHHLMVRNIGEPFSETCMYACAYIISEVVGRIQLRTQERKKAVVIWWTRWQLMHFHRHNQHQEHFYQFRPFLRQPTPGSTFVMISDRSIHCRTIYCLLRLRQVYWRIIQYFNVCKEAYLKGEGKIWATSGQEN